MIRRVKYKDINRNKYQNCLQQACNYKIYAEDWYLDIHTSHQWDCLVYRDYEAVMPLPYILKYGFKIISQPIYCQQLGVFHNYQLSNEVLQDFLKIIESYKISSYQFNESNSFLFENESFKNNYILSLNTSIHKLISNYRRDRKRDIKRISELNLELTSQFNREEFMTELKSKYPDFLRYYNMSWFENLINEFIRRDLYTYFVLKKNDEIIACIFLIQSKNRRILLLSSRSEKKEYKGAFAYLVHHFIEKNCNKDIVLDFEGSMVENIADFNKSFGAELVKYPIITYSKKELIKKIIRPK